MTVRSLSEVFLPGAAELPERLRTLTVTPTRFVEPGTTVEATFGFYNSGGATATGLRVRFAQPEGLQYIPGSAKIDGTPQTTMPDGAFVATTGALLGEIAPGVERRVSVLYRVADFIEDGTTLVLQAALAANETLIVGSNVVRLVARSRPLLLNDQTILSLEAPAGAEPGRELFVRARITNKGQSTATDVVLIFPVPEHTRYSPKTARIDGRLLPEDRLTPFDAASATVIAERLAPGQSVVADFIATIESPLDNATIIGAIARLSAREIPEFELRSNEITVASMPSFDGDGTALIINGDSEVVPGTRLRMELRASNVGTSSARRAVAQISLPQGLVYSPGSTTVDGLPITDELFESMAYAFENLGPGAAVSLAFDAVVSTPASPDAKLPVGAKLSWESGERTFGRTLTIRSEPRFTRAKNVVERGGAPMATPGDEVPFVIRILNDGTAPADDARLLLRGDSTLYVLSAESANQVLQMVENAVVLGTLVPQAEYVITVKTRISSPLADKAEVTLGAELITAQLGTMDLGVASYIIRSRPRFLPTESALERVTADALRPNRPVEVLVRILNSGTDSARDVRVVLNYPPEITVTGIAGAPLVRGELVFETIAPGTIREARVQVALASFVPNGSVISLEGRIESTGLTPVALNVVHIETRAEAEFAGELHMHSEPAEDVDAGAPLSYTLQFKNNGDGPAQSVTVRVRPPDHAIYMPASTTVNAVKADDENGTSPLWSLHGLVLTDVDPGVPVEVRFDAVVISPIASGTTLTAQATLEWDEQSLNVSAPAVRVRSSPEFASSPGGRSISIARLAARPPAPESAPAPTAFTRPPEPARPALPAIDDAATFAAPPSNAAAPEFGAPPQFGEPPSFTVAELPASDASATGDEEMPFFSPPPSTAVAEIDEDPSSFAFVEAPQTSVVSDAEAAFTAPPQFAPPLEKVEAESEASFGAPPSASLDANVEEEISFSAPPAADIDEPVAPVSDDAASHKLILEPLAQDGDDEAIAFSAPPTAGHEVAAPPEIVPAVTDTIFKLAPMVDENESAGAVSVLAFAPDRLRRTLSFLQQSDYGKLVSHLFALEAFFPDRIHNEPELDDLFIAVRDAFRSTLDRLFVRLRLPRYAIAARDLEDRSSREAVITLVKRIAEVPAENSGESLPPVGAGIRIRGPIDRESLLHALDVLGDAPLGGVTPWIACVSMLGTTVETQTENAEVLGTYRDALLAVLRVLESLPMSEFHRVLTNSSNAELDKALNDVVRVLGGPVEASSR